MPRITSQKTRQVLLVTGTSLDPNELPEKLEIYNSEGDPLSIPRGGRRIVPKVTSVLAAAVDTGKLITRAPGGGESGSIDFDSMGMLLTGISVSQACRVRLYDSAAHRDADVLRDRYTDPVDRGGLGATPNHGCLTEFLLLTTLSLVNVPADYLQVATGDTQLYYRIDNFDLAAGAITVNFTVRDVEA
jgi:hypothetical protein